MRFERWINDEQNNTTRWNKNDKQSTCLLIPLSTIFRTFYSILTQFQSNTLFSPSLRPLFATYHPLYDHP